LIIFFIAAACAWLFNAFMPQGIGLMPSYLSHPLWRSASLERAGELWSQNALFVDARDPGQYKRGHIRRAVNLSPMERKNLYPLLKPSLQAAKVIVVYGRGFSKNPAANIGQFLRKQGFEDVWVMEASLDDWRAAGYAVREPKRAGANGVGGGS
jgi:rhodanese-related sulfurtransferase